MPTCSASIQGALIQIIRNAVAHGIEAGERAAGGRQAGRRARRGRRLAARPKIAFECRDDGRGIDLDAVRRVAVAARPARPGGERLDRRRLVGVLLRGGISTSATVTDVSGRGVGLDVVREAVERLGGEVACRIEPGRGTTFELVIPRVARVDGRR